MTPSGIEAAAEIARDLRHRQRELEGLPPEDRRLRLAAELNQLWTAFPQSERRQLLDDVERLFPTGLTDSSVAIPLAAPAAGPGLEQSSPEELIAALQRKLSTLPEAAQQETRAKIAAELGIKSAPARGNFACTADQFADALETFKHAAFRNPDPVLNPNLSAFSRNDIKNLPRLAAKLKKPMDQVSEFIWNSLRPQTKQLLMTFTSRPAEQDRLAEALEEEFGRILSEGSIYEQARFAGVNLSAENRGLLGQRFQGQQLERFNQLLLESAFPEEIHFQTTEREVMEAMIEALRKSGKIALSAEQALGLAAVSLRELAGLEQLARTVLISLDKNVYDRVLGRLTLDDRNELDKLLAQFMKDGDASKLSLAVRNYTGLIKSLLYWYSYCSGLMVKQLKVFNLDPKNFGARKNMLGDIPWDTWEKYVDEFKRFRVELFRGAGKKDDSEDRRLAEEQMRELVNETIERKVTATLADSYGWPLKED